MHRRKLVGWFAHRVTLLVAILGIMAGCDGGSESPDAGPRVRVDAPPPDPRIPVLTSFVAAPERVSGGVVQEIEWTWTYAGLPFPEPTCTIDQGVGDVTNGATTSVNVTTVTTFTLTCTNSAGSATRPVVVSLTSSAPDIAMLMATPSTVPFNAATNVTWAWTYSTPTPWPLPTCSINQGVGAVTNGQTTSVTQSASRQYTLTCTNSYGTRYGYVTVLTPPSLATFTANPATVAANTPTSVTFAWSYAATPSPTPTCSIDQGIGTITSGSSRVVTLAASTVYTLTCTNTGGSDTSQLTITVP